MFLFQRLTTILGPELFDPYVTTVYVATWNITRYAEDAGVEDYAESSVFPNIKYDSNNIHVCDLLHVYMNANVTKICLKK